MPKHKLADDNTLTFTTDTSTNSEWDSMTAWELTYETANNRSADCTTNSFVTDGGSVSTGTDGCNESLMHSNVEKAIFHAVKGANRMVDEGQAWTALQIAGSAANAYLDATGEDYDPEQSEEYLYERIVDDAKSTAEVIEAGIERAFEKVESGHHLGGARIAISVADAYLDAFEPSRICDT